jgi:hypothetical protein
VIGGGVVYFMRSLEAEAFARSIIEDGRDMTTVEWGQVSKGSALREVLANEPISIFIGAAFPSVMGSGEEE